jgi:hypothetical protein
MDFILDHVGWFIGGIVVLVIACFALLVVAAIDDGERRERLMHECLADGKKEYECEAMLKQDVVPMPMIIPMPIR